MSKITKSAKGEVCALRIPMVCNHNPETTVFCHAPCVDKGWAIKSPDWWGAFGCYECHIYMDSGQGNERHWMPAIYETMDKLIDKGLIVLE